VLGFASNTIVNSLPEKTRISFEGSLYSESFASFPHSGKRIFAFWK